MIGSHTRAATSIRREPYRLYPSCMHTRIPFHHMSQRQSDAPSGEKTDDRMPSFCPCISKISAPEGEFQTRIVPSIEPEAIIVPSEQNETDWTWWGSLCGGPVGMSRMTSSPVAAFQTRTLLSKDPDTIWSPSGENFTDRTESSCPLVFKTPAPEIASQACHSNQKQGFFHRGSK